MKNKCPHKQSFQVGDAWGFTGSVSVSPYTDENRRAHGNVTILVECSACGARRRENRNQGHVEVSPWGPSRSDRYQAAERLQRAVPRPPSPTRLNCGDGRSVIASVDHSGMICLDGASLSSDDERTILAALPGAWIASAKNYRRALLRAEEAASDV